LTNGGKKVEGGQNVGFGLGGLKKMWMQAKTHALLM